MTCTMVRYYNCSCNSSFRFSYQRSLLYRSLLFGHTLKTVTFARGMPRVLLWSSLIVLGVAKVESIRFGGCWDPHCVSCPSKASSCLECSDEYVFDETGGNCVPANHHWSSQYSQGQSLSVERLLFVKCDLC